MNLDDLPQAVLVHHNLKYLVYLWIHFYSKILLQFLQIFLKSYKTLA